MKKSQLLIVVIGVFMILSSPAYSQANKQKGKVDYQLTNLFKGEKPIVVPLDSQGSSLVQNNMLTIINGKVAIDAVATTKNGAELLAVLTEMGLEYGTYYERIVSGLLPIGQIPKLESLVNMQFVRPAYTPLKSVGLVTSQADVAMRADIAKSTYNVSGAGSKIGILSDSFNALGGAAAGVASGDLPVVDVLLDFTPGSDEGRAMAELIYDIAPGAEQAFHTAFTGQAGFANGIRDLADSGCNIIVDDVFYFFEPFFQDGIIAQAVDDVVSNKVTYFSSAGNSSDTSFESEFRNSGTLVPGWGIAHDFGAGDIRQTFTLSPFGSFRVVLQWDDPFYSVSGGDGAQTDLDLLVYLNGNLTFASASNNIGGDPVEFIGLQSNSSAPISVEIVITKFSGPDPELIKWVHFGNGNVPNFIEYNTKSSTCVGHANAKGAIAVGASAFFNTPAFNSNISTAVINSFSALGGTPVFIKKDGKKTGIGPGKYRMKPEITAVDGTNTTFFGRDSSFDEDLFPNFFGTSAAAPHAAAVAALMQEVRNVTMSPSAVLDIMRQSALDMDNPNTPGFDVGFDYKTGAGLIQADICVALAGGSTNKAIVDLAPEALSLYPNPSTGTFTIDLKETVNSGELSVFNAFGTLVYSAKIDNANSEKLDIDLSDQSNGLYFLKLLNGSEVKTTRVLINR
jgi:hypothetical protein